MFKFIGRIGKSWWLFLVMILSTLANVYFDFLLPYQLGTVISDIQAGTSAAAKFDMNLILMDSLIMLFYAACSGIFAILTGKIASIVTAKICNVSRYELFKKVGQFSIEEVNKYSVSSLVTRTTNDITLVANAFNLLFRFIIYGPAVSITALVFMLIAGVGPVTFIVLTVVVLLMIFIIILVKIALPKYQSIQGHLDKVSLVTRENLEGLRVVRAYNAEDYQERKFEGVNDKLMKTEKVSNRLLGLLMPGIHLFVGFLQVGIYYVCSFLITDSSYLGTKMEYSSLAVIIQFAVLILTGFIMLTAAIVQLPRAVVCAKRVNEVIAQGLSIVGAEKTPETNEKGTIEFRNVSFYYPGSDEPALSNVSFKVRKGETIAFIGATGSGKTTLINLLPRLFDATEGEVLIDGINVKEYNLEDLNSRFGYVPQKGYLFHDTLKNNICIGKPDATPTQIERALNISQSSEFVSKLPDGINYEISQGGKNVSGGQRQRLCIARAIIMEPEFFIFDDSFSALDYRTDKVLRGEIAKQCEGVTNVIVGQRVGTIMGADQIVVLDEGKVMGIGTHKELLKTCQVYREIALSQLSKEELENE